LIIEEKERAFLYKNGVYQRMLNPGKHTVWELFGEKAVKLAADGPVDLPRADIAILLRDPEFQKSVAYIEIPDGKIAIRFTNGRFAEFLPPGVYAYWNIFQKNGYEIIDISEPESANDLPPIYFKYIPQIGYYSRCDVSEGEIGLLFFNGVYQRTLKSGRYFFWNRGADVTFKVLDTRLSQLEIPGQEILTADKVSLRVNFACRYKLTDPASAVTKLANYQDLIYVFVQLTLREFVGKYRFDELLKQKDNIGGYVLEKLKSREGEFFVEFFDAGVKDIILPGEIREIMNAVLTAEKAAQAAAVARREETAATKSMLETAKLMDENATLYRLKELEYLEKICEKIGSISLGGGGVLQNLRDLLK
jgi:regulator of protease activity HflC (stomatin/prohibitin superfamily)